MSYKTVKKSCGIALCRYTDKFQILMVKKRYSYAYADFVAGKYSCNDANKITLLFSGMTSEEKMEVESNNFSQMWYRIWRYNPEIEECNSKERGNYNTAKKKYTSTTKKHDLIEMLNNSDISDCIWDIPKGRINREEKDITCAIREMNEETNISPEYYRLYPHCVNDHHYDAGVKYINNFYIATETLPVQLKINYKNKHQISEIIDIRWMGIDEIKREDHTGRYLRVSKMIFNILRKNYGISKIIKSPGNQDTSCVV